MSSPERLAKDKKQLEAEKQAAARAALPLVRSGMTLGLGTGSTAAYFIAFLGERVRRGELSVEAVPSSRECADRAKEAGIPLITPRRGLRLDLAVDGADEIAPDLSLIKGRGGALLREKMLAQASRSFVVIADSSKRVRELGAAPLPVEVVPFGWPWAADRIAALGADPVLRLSPALPARSDAEEPFRTDQQNFILDCHFHDLRDPSAIARRLEEIPGVVAHGLFIACVERAFVAEDEKIVVLRPAAARSDLS